MTSERVRIETKSAWYSKINWTQAVGIACSLIALFTAGKYNLPAEEQAMLVVAIQSIQGLVTWALKTWFTPTITPASAWLSGEKTVILD